MRFARAAIIFGIGLFALVSQALLFREFLVSFEGNELGIGAFFGSWFIWIALGASLIYRGGARTAIISRHIDLLALLYLLLFPIHLQLSQYLFYSFSTSIYFLSNLPKLHFLSVLLTLPLSSIYFIRLPLKLLTISYTFPAVL